MGSKCCGCVGADQRAEVIKNKDYPEAIKQYTGNIILVAINYDKKSKNHECIIEKLSVN